MYCRLKIFYLHADETQTRFVREEEPADESRSNCMSTVATDRGSSGFVLVTRIRALWSSRG